MSFDGTRSASSGSAAVAVACLPDDWELGQQLGEAADRLEAFQLDCAATDPYRQLAVAIRTILNEPQPSFERFRALLGSDLETFTPAFQLVDPWNEVCLAILAWDPFEPKTIVFGVELSTD